MSEIEGFSERSDRPKGEIILKALEKVPAIKDTIAGGYLGLSPIKVRWRELVYYRNGKRKDHRPKIPEGTNGESGETGAERSLSGPNRRGIK